MDKRKYVSLPWDDWYCLAKGYYREYNHLLIPAKYKTVCGYGLGKWIERQRCLYNKKSYLMTEDRIMKLEMIGMVYRAAT